jgi:histidinol-phosphate aminotransferase
MYPRQRDVMSTLPVYKAGKRAAAGGVKLSSNENPYPPLPSVLEAIERAATQVNRYPDPGSTALVQAIAERHEVPTDWVTVSCGSVALVGQAVSIVADQGDEVVYSWPSFEAYPIVTGIAGAKSVVVPLDGAFRQDLTAVADAVTDRTRCVFVCTPNNPTGTIVRHDEVVRLLERVPGDVLVVIDEAYAEFVDDPQGVDALALVREHANVVVLRTFSKAYGLAGLRVGYSIAHPEVSDGLRKTAIPFGVSVVAHDAAIASLAAEEELLERVRLLRDERTRVVSALRQAGWEPADSHGNFVWLGTGADTEQVAAELLAAGITARAFPGVGIRITVAETDANDALIEHLTNL